MRLWVHAVCLGLPGLGLAGTYGRPALALPAGPSAAQHACTRAIRIPYGAYVLGGRKLIPDEVHDRLCLLLPGRGIQLVRLSTLEPLQAFPCGGKEALFTEEGLLISHFPVESKGFYVPAEGGKLALGALKLEADRARLHWLRREWRAGPMVLHRNRLYVLTQNDEATRKASRTEFNSQKGGYAPRYLVLLGADGGRLAWSSDIWRPLWGMTAGIDPWPPKEGHSPFWIPEERRVHMAAWAQHPLYLTYWPSQKGSDEGLVLCALGSGVLAFDSLLGGLQWALPAYPAGSRFVFCGRYALSTSTYPRGAGHRDQHVYWLDRDGNQVGKFDPVPDEAERGTLGTWWLGANGNAFIAQVDGNLWSYDLVEDRPLWKSDVSFEDSTWVHYEGDLVSAGVAYGIAAGCGSILGVDVNTGKVVWQHEVEGQVHALAAGEKYLVAYVLPPIGQRGEDEDATIVSLSLFRLPGEE